MEISNTWAPMLVQAVCDALAYQRLLLKSERLRDRGDYEEHLGQLVELLEHVKAEYRLVEDAAGIPLEELLE